MKHLFTYLVGWLLLASPVRAQTTDPVRQKLDKIQVPTDCLLYDAVRDSTLTNGAD